MNNKENKKFIEREILKATKINMNNINQIMSKPLRHENLKEDYKDLIKFVKKLFKEDYGQIWRSKKTGRSFR